RMEPQLAIGATHEIRIFTGSACAAALMIRAQRPARASFCNRILSSQYSAVSLNELARDCRRSACLWQARSRRARYPVQRLNRARIARFRMPEQEPAADKRHRLHQD